MTGGSVPILTEAVIEQISHLSPAELAALLVRGAAPMAPDADVHFCATSGCFARAPRGRVLVHCLHWSARSGASPPSRVPLVGDALRADRAGADGTFLRVSSAGADTLLAPRARGSSVGVLRLTRGGSGVYGRATRRAHALWDFCSQILSDEGAAGLSEALTVELFSRKMIAWIFACFTRLQVAPSRQLSLRQLEMAFPLLLALDAPQRTALVSDAVARLSGGLLSYYNGRVIARRGVPVSAAALLAPAELAAVTAVEQASAAFVFRCQLRHEAALGALQGVADAWVKRRAVSPSAHICAAVAALLAHAAGTCALLVPPRSTAAVRAVVALHIPAMFATGAAAARAAALLRGGNVTRHRATLRALLAEAEALKGQPAGGAVGSGGGAVGSGGGAVGSGGGAVGSGGGAVGSGGGAVGSGGGAVGSGGGAVGSGGGAVGSGGGAVGSGGGAVGSGGGAVGSGGGAVGSGGGAVGSGGGAVGSGGGAVGSGGGAVGSGGGAVGSGGGAVGSGGGAVGSGGGAVGSGGGAVGSGGGAVGSGGGAVGSGGGAVGSGGGAVGSGGGAVGSGGGAVGSGGGAEGALPDAACGFFESVSPALHGAGVAWRVSAGGRYTPMPPPPHSAAPQRADATPGAQLLEAVLCGFPRIGFARPMLRVSELGAPALRLNMGPRVAAEMATSSDEEVWHAPRKRRRGADRAED